MALSKMDPPKTLGTRGRCEADTWLGWQIKGKTFKELDELELHIYMRLDVLT